MPLSPREIRLGDARLLLRAVRPADAPQVLRLFVRVFGHDPGMAWYVWKYGAQGLDGRAVGLWDEHGQLVAHYAGFPRRLLWHGRPIEAIQIGDLMVAPEMRGWLTRRGPFFQVSSAFHQAWIGHDRPYAISFGFTHERAMRLGVKLGVYHDLSEIAQLEWPARKGRLPFGWLAKEIEAPFEMANRCLAKAKKFQDDDAGRRIIGVRDADYLARRYSRRPDKRYRYLFLRRLLHGPVALAVLSEETNTIRWLDHIGPQQCLPIMARAVSVLAAQSGCQSVTAWASPALQSALIASGGGCAGVAARFALITASACPAAPLARDGIWWAGDTEFL